MSSQTGLSQENRDPEQNVPPQFVTVTRTGGATQPATSTTVATIPVGGRLYIQNVSTANDLYVKLGEAASTTSFDFKLPAGSATAPTNLHLPFLIADYVGPVTVAGTSPTYVATLLN